MKKYQWIDGIYQELAIAFNQFGSNSNFTNREDSIAIQSTLDWLSNLSEGQIKTRK